MYLKDKTDIIVSDKTELSSDSQGNLVLRKEGKRQTLPLERVGSLQIIKQNPSIDYEVLQLCKKFGVAITFLTQNYQIVADVHFGYPKNVHLRVRQTQLHLDDIQRLEIAKKFLLGKWQNSYQFLKSIDPRHSHTNITDLSDVNDQPQLLGLEGALAQKYFDTYSQAFRNPELPFRGRSKHPPLDEVNALLSFLYTILNNDIMHMLQSCGLDPYIGFLHHDYYGRPSLSCDFLEEFRSVFVDKLVLIMVNRREFSKDDFEHKEVVGRPTGVYLKKDSLRKLFAKWSAWYKGEELLSKRWNEKCTRRRLIEKQIRHFIGFLIGDETDYLPFNINTI